MNPTTPGRTPPCGLNPHRTCREESETPQSWVHIPVTSMVQGWSHSPSTNRGFAVRALQSGYTKCQTSTNNYGGSFNSSQGDHIYWWTPTGPAMCGYQTHENCGYGPSVRITWNYVKPSAPTNVQLTASGSNLNVNFNESTTGTYANWYGIDLYDARTGAFVGKHTVDLGAQYGQPGDLSQHTFTGLPPGSYRVEVYAITGHGDELISSDKALAGPTAIGTTDPNLGFEPWWSYERGEVAEQSDYAVNVGNGNVVIQATDATPVQGHGDLSYVLRRTFNSQDSTLLPLPGSLGSGWDLNVGAVSTVAGSGITPTGLKAIDGKVPLQLPWYGGSVELYDRDGTRHTFVPKSKPLGDALTPLVSIVQGVVNDLLTGNLANIVPRVLEVPAWATNLCVDQAYQAPAGVHLALFRYLAVKSVVPNDKVNACRSTNWATSNAEVFPAAALGFATVRPDGLRNEFDLLGRLVSVVDRSGVELRYHYNPLGQLATVYEPRSCSDAAITARLTTATEATTNCRAFQFTYGSQDSHTVTWVLDPGGRRTGYYTSAGGQLAKVVNNDNKDPSSTGPDETATTYTYGGCTGAAPSQLCKITDARSNQTSFGASGISVGSPGHAARG